MGNFSKQHVGIYSFFLSVFLRTADSQYFVCRIRLTVYGLHTKLKFDEEKYTFLLSFSIFLTSKAEFSVMLSNFKTH
jgi:hypothetical protein